MESFVVFFDCPSGHRETVLRDGPDAASVAYPDDLGCPVADVQPAADFVFLDAWVKNGELRVKVEPLPVDAPGGWQF